MTIQVHHGINLSTSNELLSVHCGQYLHLAPEQEALICELLCGNLNLLLLDKLETNS